MSSRKRKVATALVETMESRTLLSGIGAAALTHTTANLSAARGGIVAISAGQDILFAGGTSDGNPSSVVDIYNRQTQQWSTTTLPSTTISYATASGDTAYFVDATAGTAYEYDTSAGTWSTISYAFLAGTTAGYTQLDGDILFVNSTGDTLIGPTTTGSSESWGRVFTVSGTDEFSSSSQESLSVTLTDSLSQLTRSISVPLSVPDGFEVAVSGPNVLFVSDNGGSAEATTAYLYNTITGRGSAVAVPAGLRITTDTSNAPVIGTQAIFPHAYVEDSHNRFYAYSVADYDFSTGVWSTSPLTGVDRYGLASGAVDDTVLLAGGTPVSPSGASESSQVDLFQDQNPAAVLAGGVQGRSNGEATVLLQNVGDAALAGSYTVNVYAIPPGRYSGSILLGSEAVSSPLQAGNTITLDPRISIPSGAVPGTYHLVAMVQTTGGTLIPFAGGLSTLTIKASTSTDAEPMIPAAVSDSTESSSSDDSLLIDQGSVLA